MTDRHLALIKKEQQLNEKEADLFREQTKMEQLEDDYFGHFSKANHLFSDIRYLFSRSNDAQLFEELSHDIYQESRTVEETLLSARKSTKHHYHECGYVCLILPKLSMMKM